VSEPVASRPTGFEPIAAEGGKGALLPWSWAEERLEASHNYWVSSVCEDGHPHAMAVWALWYAGGLWFSTGENTRKARNLARDPRCTLTTERADEAVILEGIAELMDQVPAEVPRQYEAKYGMAYPPSAVFVVRPSRVFGFVEDPVLFSETATKWTFE
jgi:hypothetical protein